MKMELPVSNRNIAIRRIMAFNYLLLVLFIVIVLQTQDLDTLNYFLIVIFISLIISFIHLKKQNIHKAFFENGLIILTYNKCFIELPLSQIISISECLNDYMTLKGKMSFTYTIKLKNKYQFGNRLYLYFDKLDKFGIEPKEIIELRERIKK
jgi:hypothetical protein